VGPAARATQSGLWTVLWKACAYTPQGLCAAIVENLWTPGTILSIAAPTWDVFVHGLWAEESGAMRHPQVRPQTTGAAMSVS
jgi:hypothetical protein